jgi:HEAT repeat protein
VCDPDRNIREESLVGLGKRKDQRVVPALIALLNQPEATDRVKEATEAFLSDKEQVADRSPADYIAALKTRFAL